MLGANAITTASDGTGSASLDLSDWAFGNQLATFLNDTNGPYSISLAPQAGKYSVNIETAHVGGGYSYLFLGIGLLAGGFLGWKAYDFAKHR